MNYLGIALSLVVALLSAVEVVSGHYGAVPVFIFAAALFVYLLRKSPK